MMVRCLHRRNLITAARQNRAADLRLPEQVSRLIAASIFLHSKKIGKGRKWARFKRGPDDGIYQTSFNYIYFSTSLSK